MWFLLKYEEQLVINEQAIYGGGARIIVRTGVYIVR